jgi:hypothetical protein
MNTVRVLLCFVIFSSFPADANAQRPRERADPTGPVGEVFWAQNIIVTSSVANLQQGDVNVTIMHSFGFISDGFDDLFGLDAAANIRFGVDYGVTERLSIGVGRSRFDKLWDFRAKGNLLRQSKDGSMPLELAFKGSMAIETVDSDLGLTDRLSYFASAMLARKFTGRVSIQISPMYSHFNTVFVELGPEGQVLEPENSHFAVGIAGRVALSSRVAILFEYVPVIGSRSDGTKDAVSLGMNLETGGHVFQLFFTTSQWFTEQHMIARNRDVFFDGDIRFGFNVNRIFGLH